MGILWDMYVSVLQNVRRLDLLALRADDAEIGDLDVGNKEEAFASEVAVGGREKW
jgi:hypothetical protein